MKALRHAHNEVKTSKSLPLHNAPHSYLEMRTLILGDLFLESKLEENKLTKLMYQIKCTSGLMQASKVM